MSRETHITSDGHRLGLHDSVSSALMDLIREHRPAFPDLAEIAARAGQPEEAVRKVFGSVQDILDTLAEQGLMRLFDQCVRTITKAPADDPVAQFRAVGRAYLTWAFENPAFFVLLQHSKLADVDGNPKLLRYTDSMRELMLRLLRRAHESGQITNKMDPELVVLTGRSLLFGLARMGIDSNMESWHPGMEAQEAAYRSFDDFVRMVATAAVSNSTRKKPASA